MNCKCYAKPRTLIIKNNKIDDFVNTCINCGGSGGNLGNVCHNYNCKFLNCIHGQGSFNLYNSQYIEEADNTTNSPYYRWTIYQPSFNVRTKHIKFREMLSDHLNEKIKLIYYNKLIKKVKQIIYLKTKVYIDL